MSGSALGPTTDKTDMVSTLTQSNVFNWILIYIVDFWFRESLVLNSQDMKWIIYSYVFFFFFLTCGCGAT